MAKQISRVIVEPVEDLDFGAVGQLPVGEVGLPALVGLGGLEAVVGAFGAFAWLWGDQAVVVQDAPDRGGGRHGQAGSVQVTLQGQRPGVEALVDEGFTQPHDGGDYVIVDCPGVAGWAPRSGVDGLQAALVVSLEQPMQMLAREPVGLGCCGDTQLTTDDMKDGDPRFGHEPRLSPNDATHQRPAGVTHDATHLSPMS